MMLPCLRYYPQAVEKMADIYLHYRKDRQRYAGCYLQLVEKRNDARSYLLLGDAYMNIQEVHYCSVDVIVVSVTCCSPSRTKPLKCMKQH